MGEWKQKIALQLAPRVGRAWDIQIKHLVDTCSIPGIVLDLPLILMGHWGRWTYP